MEKTNVMRILDQKKIPYHHYEYDNSQAYSGTEVADMLGQDPKVVYKTLVTVAKSKKNYVFVIPVEEELDLKKAAKAANEKSIEMLEDADISLEDSFKVYKEGMKLVQTCNSKIDKVEKEVLKLNENGELDEF